MGMQINTNVAALNANRNLGITQNALAKSLEKLSSGLRINRAADDAAGLAISEGLRSQISGIKVASRNAQDGVSLVQTAEGELTEVHSILHRMRDLAVQAANDTNNTDSRAAIKAESDALSEELTRISASTNFNGIDLLTAAAAGTPLTFQVGAGSAAAANQITVNLVDVAAIGTTTAALTYDTAANAALSIDALDTAITTISTARGELGAQQNRFESAINSLAVTGENLAAAESRIRDTDMAAEMVNYTRANILSQAGTAMLAQANQSTQGVLQLLR